MNTDSEQLIDAKVGWRMRQARFDAAFPQQTNLTLVVIDGATPELAGSAAAAADRKTGRQSHALHPCPAVPMAAPSSARTGCCSCRSKDVQDTTQQLIKAQPFLGGLASDPSLRGIATNLSTALAGCQHAATPSWRDFDSPWRASPMCFDAAAHGKTRVHAPGVR